ncbi:MAG TPA: DUF2892 domain-containing protein [Acidobacteriota bacterium]|nr:DUF2892 domain-containing protein [Acidobacteriota bacterium]
MSVEHTIRAIAGTFVLVSLALGWFVSPYWLLFTAFVGLNLLQSSVTKWCLMEDFLRKTVFARRNAGADRSVTTGGSCS